MTGRRELLLHRVATACALGAALATLGFARGFGARTQEPSPATCACGQACACAETHRADAPVVAQPAPADVVAKLFAARRAANEAAAIASLRNLTSAQAMVQSAGIIDGDADGIGEYAYFGELSGLLPIRARMGRGYGIGSEKIVPPILASSFGNVVGSTVAHNGYLFQVFLPDSTGQGVAESASGGADPERLPAPDYCEIVWCAYAWPVERGQTGERAFFVNQEGDLLACANAKRAYSGAAVVPAAEAAFAKGGKAGSIDQSLAAAKPGKVGMDGEVWAPFE